MKAIINGKRYDTDRAELIHHWSNGSYPSDFRFRAKTLFRTRLGNWFIHHEGGPLTDMARPCGTNSTTGSEMIEPITENEAFEFLQTHEGVSAAEKYFADRIEEA